MNITMSASIDPVLKSATFERMLVRISTARDNCDNAASTGGVKFARQCFEQARNSDTSCARLSPRRPRTTFLIVGDN